MKTEQEIYSLITEIAKNDNRIRAVYVHGSRANPNNLFDKYSDYDIVYVVTEIHSFISDKEWINCFGDISFTFEAYRMQNNFFMEEINDISRRYVWSMLFKDGTHIDLLLELVDDAMTHEHILDKPTVVLLDKDGCLPDNSLSKKENYVKN